MSEIKRYPYDAGYHSEDPIWLNRGLRMSDQFPALCYAHGIFWNDLIKDFPELYYDGKDFFNDTENLLNIETQLSYIADKKRRSPKNFLEIGAGRGELSCSVKKLNLEITAVDVATRIQNWAEKTGKHFFGDLFAPPTIIQSNINDLDLPWDKFDTILIVETLEHIHEEDFKKTWRNIIQSFHGSFIVTNMPCMHPIPVGGDWPDAELQHCRPIDDELYDQMSSVAKQVLLRYNSHLVLEF